MSSEKTGFLHVETNNEELSIVDPLISFSVGAEKDGEFKVFHFYGGEKDLLKKIHSQFKDRENQPFWGLYTQPNMIDYLVARFYAHGQLGPVWFQDTRSPRIYDPLKILSNGRVRVSEGVFAEVMAPQIFEAFKDQKNEDGMLQQFWASKDKEDIDYRSKTMILSMYRIYCATEEKQPLNSN